jgi:hypothetical protein
MGVLRVAARFAAGKHLDGKARSDATFLARGTSGSPHWWGTGRESWWSMLPGWRRAAYRWLAVAVLAGLWRWRHDTEWALALAGGPAAGLAAVRLRRAVGRWAHERQLVRPMAAALAPFLGIPPRAVEDGLAVSRGYADADAGEHVGTLALPDHWAATPEQKMRVGQVVRDRLGVDLKYQWQTARYPMVLNMTRAPVPPAMVLFADVRAEIEACPAGQVVLGKAAGGKVHYGDLDLEDPHWAINANTKRGKTTLLLAIAAQELHKGAERVTGIDPKMISLDPIAGIPGVDLRNDPHDVQDMWDGIASFIELIDKRMAAFKADRTVQFRRALLILEEVNMFAAMSGQYWQRIKDKSDPALPPVWNDIAKAVWTGAQFRVNVIVDGQRLDGPTLKNLRDSFGVRLLAGFTPQQYSFLVGLSPVLRSQKPRGRFLLFEGGELTWLQLVRWTDEEIRDYAMEGRRHAADLGPMALGGTRDMAPRVVGLAAAAGHLGMEIEAFRKARSRRPVPGETVTADGRPAWPAAALTAWRESRPSARLRDGDGQAGRALAPALGDGQ